MCDFCEKQQLIEKYGFIVYIDSDNDLCVDRVVGDEFAYYDINYCPMCGRKLKDK